jgi:hypothetical protein
MMTWSFKKQGPLAVSFFFLTQSFALVRGVAMVLRRKFMGWLKIGFS